MWEPKRTGRINETWGQDIMWQVLPSRDSIVYDFYLIQLLPDFLVQKAGAFEKFNELFDEQREAAHWHDPNRILHFMTYVGMANKLDAGDYAEFGVGHGFSFRYIYKLMNEQSTLYLFDTFEGFKQEDVDIENQMFDTNISVHMLGSDSAEDLIEKVTGGENKRDIEVIPVQGRIPESFAPHSGLKFRFVSVDMDLYEPTAKLLESLWDCMVPGGILLFHDYGCKLFPGVAKAVDEFFNPRGITAVPLNDQTVSAIVIKPLH